MNETWPEVFFNDSDYFVNVSGGSFEQNQVSNGSSGSTRYLGAAWWQSTVWSIVFGLLITVAVGGNLIVMWIVLAHRRMWTVTNYFLVNLSISDLLLAVLNCVFNFVYMLNNDWPFGQVYCRISNFVATFTVAASVFTLTATSFDRYMAIVHPLRPRMSRRTALVVIAFIWTSSGCLALPYFIYSKTRPYSIVHDYHLTACYVHWPDAELPHESLLDYIYNLIFLALTYAIPVLGMVVCYSIIGQVLWGENQIGELNQRHVETLRSKRKVVRMFIVMVTLFALCWLPYHLYFISVYHNPSIASYRYIKHIYLFFYWLAMSNAMVNPLIYYFLNARFRNYFRRLICWMVTPRRSSFKRQASCNEIPLRPFHAVNRYHPPIGNSMRQHGQLL